MCTGLEIFPAWKTQPTWIITILRPMIFQPYDVGFIQNGEWEDYTRNLSNNVTYAVYAHGWLRK